MNSFSNLAAVGGLSSLSTFSGGRVAYRTNPSDLLAQSSFILAAVTDRKGNTACGFDVVDKIMQFPLPELCLELWVRARPLQTRDLGLAVHRSATRPDGRQSIVFGELLHREFLINT